MWMASAPVVMMTTLHHLDAEIEKERWFPGNKSTNATGAASEFQGQPSKNLQIPLVVHEYNQHKVGVDVADQYRTYYDVQLTSRRNWYPYFYWALETSLINTLLIYRSLLREDITHLQFRLQVAWALIHRGNSLQRAASQNITCISRQQKKLDLPLKVYPNTQLPEVRKAPGPHLPEYMGGNRLCCFFCRWESLHGRMVKGKEAKTQWKCETCKQPLCINGERNCFMKFHHVT